MKEIKLPNPITMIFGSMGAFWIADIVNPGFNPVGVMILLLIPIFIFEFLYPEPEPELEKLIEHRQPAPEESVSAEMTEEELAQS